MLLTMASWLAPAATMIAAMMTAANLGARVTGWGFVVFTVGAVGWIIVALASGQHNLLLANSFLLLIDIVGIWRWLGVKARYDDGAAAAARHSARRPSATLFPLSTLAGMAVTGPDGARIGAAVDAMAARDDGRIAYLVVGEGGVAGVGERLHALAWDRLAMGDEGIAAGLDADGLARLPALKPDKWPSAAEVAGG